MSRSAASPLRRAASRALAVALLTTAGLAAAPAVHASPWEQISRANGPAGGSLPLPASYAPAAVGDVGRYVGYQRSAQSIGGGVQREFNDARNNTAWIRDVQADVNLDFGGGLRRVFGIDRKEQWALLGRYRSGKSQIVLQWIAGGPPFVLEEYAGQVWNDGRILPNAILSGDGQTSIITTERAVAPPLLHDGATYALNSVTGWRPISTNAVWFAKNGISDDGSVFVGTVQGEGFTTIFGKDFTRQVRFGTPAVSANGRWAAWFSIEPSVPPYATVMDVDTGAKRTFTLPATIGPDDYFAGSSWLSPDGSRLRIAPNAREKASARASELTLATGQWTQLSPRFGRSLSMPHPFDGRGSRESVNGKFAAVPSSVNQVSLVDLTEQHIPGANQALSAASYLAIKASTYGCPITSGDVAVQLMKADFWAPAPVRAAIKLTQGTTVLSSTTLTSAIGPLGGFDAPMLVPGANAIRRPHNPQGPAPKLSATVTDDQGRQLSETWTLTPESTETC